MTSKLPVFGKLIDYIFFHHDKIIFLPRNNTIKINQQIDVKNNFENVVMSTKIIEHFIDSSNYHFIMNSCICRESADCKHYPVDLGCLFLGKSVLDINPKLGRLVSRAQALEHIQKCQDAGLVHLIGRNKLDKLWLGVKHGHQLLTVCNCCPCCCLWKMLPDLAPHINENMIKMPGVSIRVTNNCIGCGTCTQDVCFVNAIQLVDNRAVISEVCMGCGRCVVTCPQNAIVMDVGKSEGIIERSIDMLSPMIDLS